MELTIDQLKQLLPKNPYVSQWHHALSQLLPDYEINTAKRIAAFIAQCAHESGGFLFLKENLNYKAETLTRIWPKYFPSDVAKDYASRPNKQEAIANRAYANRMGNGDEASGDGWKFCGRGLIQLTGRDNYQAFADSLQISVDDAAQYLETFEGCVQSACWFWENNNLNALADQGNIDAISKKVNGGTEGLENRRNFYQQALQVLS